MIEFQEALAHVKANSQPLDTVKIPLTEAAGYYLAASLHAPLDHPFFDQSAMDGYAVRFEDLALHQAFKLEGEVAAGDAGAFALGSGQVARIFTGAPTPLGADTVIMQEHATVNGDSISFAPLPPKAGMNVRKKGEQIKAGALALEAGTQLTPSALGFLKSLGFTEVEVYRKPQINLAVTGSEFAESAEDLKRGKIFDSNGEMLVGATQQLQLATDWTVVVDNPELLEKEIGRLATEANILLVTGGVSVGKYDFTKSTLEALGYETIFHKVNQKPGKPLLFMRKGKKLAFGLPGNPRAAMICFYMYVLPAIQALQGAKQQGLKTLKLPLKAGVQKKDGKTHFLAIGIEDMGAVPLDKQLSHMLQSLALADAVMVFEAKDDALQPETEVLVHLLP